MRPKFILTVMVLAALAVAPAFYFKRHVARFQPPTRAETATLPVAAASGDAAAAWRSTSSFKPAPAANTMTLEQKQAYIEREISRLQVLSTKDDPASLTAILNDLTNSEKAIRLAAIEATKQFGSRDAIPALKADVANTPDIHDQIALLQAADFLSLPTIADSDVQVPLTAEQTQAAEQRRDQAAARRQALLQRHAQGQNP